MCLYQVLRFLFLIWPINIKPGFTLPVILIIDSLGFILWLVGVGLVLGLG